MPHKLPPSIRWRFFWLKVERWFYNHDLIRCADCGRSYFRKDMHVEQSLIGPTVHLCKECRKSWFQESK